MLAQAHLEVHRVRVLAPWVAVPRSAWQPSGLPSCTDVVQAHLHQPPGIRSDWSPWFLWCWGTPQEGARHSGVQNCGIASGLRLETRRWDEAQCTVTAIGTAAFTWVFEEERGVTGQRKAKLALARRGPCWGAHTLG